jgi:hypothetical protein
MKTQIGHELIIIPDHAIAERLPDTERYINRFKINSSSSDAKYLISYDNALGAGYWTCSCRGNIRWGKCRHLESLGLLTRYDKTVRRLG